MVNDMSLLSHGLTLLKFDLHARGFVLFGQDITVLSRVHKHATFFNDNLLELGMLLYTSLNLHSVKSNLNLTTDQKRGKLDIADLSL